MKDQSIEQIIQRLQEGLMRPGEQIDFCRRKISNFRQTTALDTLINLCEKEPLAVKLNKVVLNINALLYFASISDEEMSAYMSRNIKDIYGEAFDYFGLEEDYKSELIEKRGSPHPTTVEVNAFINMVILWNVNRINDLPASQSLKSDLVDRGLMREDTPLYTSADIRERAIIYFATLNAQEKLKAMNEISSRYGFLLTRLNDKQYEKKIESMRSSRH